MINDQQQDLACLYALGSLPADEAEMFESALAADGKLRNFTRDLRCLTPLLAWASPASEPPQHLRSKILAVIRHSEKVVRPDFQGGNPASVTCINWIPWVAAACMTFASVVLYQQNSTLKQSRANLRLTSAGQQQQFASLRVELADWKSKDRLSQMRIAMLGSLLESSPKAVAVSLWDAEKQDGVLVVQNLTPLPTENDYQLWVIDPQHSAPIDAGVFTVDEKGNVRFRFKPKLSVKSADKFAVTLEKKGGAPAPQGQMVLAGTWL